MASIDQLTYNDFIHSIPVPTCFSILNLPPLQGSGVIEIDSRVYSSMLDILFGGDGNHIKPGIELTGLEKFVMQNLIVRSFEKIHDS